MKFFSKNNKSINFLKNHQKKITSKFVCFMSDIKGFANDQTLQRSLSNPKETSNDTINLKKKRAGPCVFKTFAKLALNSASSSIHNSFPFCFDQNYIVIEDDNDKNETNFTNDNLESQSNSAGEKTNKKTKTAHSDDDCYIIEKNTVDMSIYHEHKQKKERFLNFKNKSKGFLQNEDDFPKLMKKPIRKTYQSIEKLQRLLVEMSQSQNIKVSDLTLNNILSGISYSNDHLDLEEPLNENINENGELKESIFNEVKPIENPIEMDSQNIPNENNENTQEHITLEGLAQEIFNPISNPNSLPFDKGIRVGEKYQAKLPRFYGENYRKSLLQLEKNKIWEAEKIKSQEFAECKKLVENILRLNCVNEEVLCDLLAKNNYTMQDTVKYCFANSKSLQAKIIENYLAETHSNRRTRNSLYNKFLLK